MSLPSPRATKKVDLILDLMDFRLNLVDFRLNLMDFRPNLMDFRLNLVDYKLNLLDLIGEETETGSIGRGGASLRVPARVERRGHARVRELRGVVSSVVRRAEPVRVRGAHG